MFALDHDSAQNGRVTYQIATGNELGQWSIDADSGIISVGKKLSLEYAETVLLVKAIDGGSPSRSDTATVRLLTVIAENSAPSFTR